MEKKEEDSPIVSFIVYSCSGGEDSPEEVAAKRAQVIEDTRKGFHCLSSWDGSHREFKNAVEAMMRDPDSFEHIETRVSPVSSDGNHTLEMQYRAKNGFGGMNVGTAIGTYRNSDCKHTIIAAN